MRVETWSTASMLVSHLVCVNCREFAFPKKKGLNDGGGLLGDEVSINTCEASCLINQFREMKESP